MPICLYMMWLKCLPLYDVHILQTPLYSAQLTLLMCNYTYIILVVLDSVYLLLFSRYKLKKDAQMDVERVITLVMDRTLVTWKGR